MNPGFRGLLSGAQDLLYMTQVWSLFIKYVYSAKNSAFSLKNLKVLRKNDENEGIKPKKSLFWDFVGKY
jgi:hypothetical protein